MCILTYSTTTSLDKTQPSDGITTDAADDTEKKCHFSELHIQMFSDAEMTAVSKRLLAY